MLRLGKNISYLRKQHKFSQAMLGKKVGVSQTSIAHYEIGSRQPTIDTLIALSDLFDESIDSLVGSSSEIDKEKLYYLNDSEVVDSILNHLMDKDERMFFQFFENRVMPFYSTLEITENILKNVLYQTGSLWQKGVITEADEHYITNILRKAIAYLSIKNISKIKNTKAISFSIGSEKHTLGIEMVNTYLETLGVNCLYLGNNIPVRSLEHTIKEFKPDYLFISITMIDHINSLMDLIEFLDTDSNDFQIIIGGQAVKSIKELKKYDNITLIDKMKDIKDIIKQDSGE